MIFLTALSHMKHQGKCSDALSQKVMRKNTTRDMAALLLALLVILLASGCNTSGAKKQQEASKDTTATAKKDLLRLYDKQIRAYYLNLTEISDGGILSMSNKAQVEYTDIAVELIDEAIRRKGYKPVDNETARKAIMKYFGVDVMQSNDIQVTRDFRTYIFKNGNTVERAKQEKAMNEHSFEEQGYFWNRLIYVPNYNYIANSPTIDMAVNIKGLPDETIDESDRKTIRHGELYFNFNDSIFFNENNFIFHDSKAAFSWLKKNDAEFLINLLRDYGYDKNEEINKLVMANMLKEYTPVGEPWMLDNTVACKKKTKHPKVEIREGLLKSILKQPATEENKEWEILFNDYIDYLLNEEEQKLPMWMTEFTKKERYKVAAYLCYYLYKISKKNGYADTSLLGHALYYNNAFYKYIVDQHYFNLPGFEALCYKVYDDYDTEVKIRTHQDE